MKKNLLPFYYNFFCRAHSTLLLLNYREALVFSEKGCGIIFTQVQIKFRQKILEAMQMKFYYNFSYKLEIFTCHTHKNYLYLHHAQQLKDKIFTTN